MTDVLASLAATKAAMAEGDRKRKAALKPVEGVTRVQDLPAERGLFDVYTPEGTGKLPVIVNIHGGAWFYGDKRLNEFYCAHLAKAGFAVVSIEYRLVPQTDLAGQIADLFEALHAVAAGDAGERADLSRLYLTGDSAGGHLTLLSLCIMASPALQAVYKVTPPPLTVRAAGVSHPVQDPSAMLGTGDETMTGLYRLLTNGDEIAARCDFSVVSKGLTLPPIYAVSCEQDGFSPLARKLIAQLEAEGRPYGARFWTATESGRLNHVFDVGYPDWPESQETMAGMLDFFRTFG